MNPNNPQSIGESQVTPQAMGQVTPDMVSPQGKQALFQNLAQATQEKDKLDFIFKGIADKEGADFSSRVKNPKTVVQKIAQKRLQGRDYKLDDINDAYGSRIIVDSEKDYGKIKKYVEKAAELGIFKINKSELVDTDYHKAWHIDFKTANGTKGELQILTPQQEANSVINHDLRSVHGEDMPDTVKELADKQAAIVKNMPSDKARQLAQTISDLHKNTHGQPLPPQVNATILAQSQANK